MYYYRGRSLMSGYDLGPWFAKIFALLYSWLENILHRLTQILRPLHYMIGNSDWKRKTSLLSKKKKKVKIVGSKSVYFPSDGISTP